MRENRCYDVEIFVISSHSETFSREKIARQLDNNALCCVNRELVQRLTLMLAVGLTIRRNVNFGSSVLPNSQELYNVQKWSRQAPTRVDALVRKKEPANLLTLLILR